MNGRRKNKKAVLLAGGKGTRLYPVTAVFNKHLAGVYNKPMIFYSLSTLILSEFSNICIVCSEDQKIAYEALLGDGENFGICLTYALQNKARGIPDGLYAAKEFVGDDRVCLMLGDNIFLGDEVSSVIKKVWDDNVPCIFLKSVEVTRDYGVAVLSDDCTQIESLVEKPPQTISPFAITGLYILDNNSVEYARTLPESPRGETEIVELLKIYLRERNLTFRTVTSEWFDVGTFERLRFVSDRIHHLEADNKALVGCPYEASRRVGFIDHIPGTVSDLFGDNEYRTMLLDSK